MNYLENKPELLAMTHHSDEQRKTQAQELLQQIIQLVIHFTKHPNLEIVELTTNIWYQLQGENLNLPNK